MHESAPWPFSHEPNVLVHEVEAQRINIEDRARRSQARLRQPCSTYHYSCLATPRSQHNLAKRSTDKGARAFNEECILQRRIYCAVVMWPRCHMGYWRLKLLVAFQLGPIWKFYRQVQVTLSARQNRQWQNLCDNEIWEWCICDQVSHALGKRHVYPRTKSFSDMFKSSVLFVHDEKQLPRGIFRYLGPSQAKPPGKNRHLIPFRP